MPQYSTILYEVRDKVAHLTLNRPESANALGPTVAAEMMDAVVRSEDDRANVRAMVVTGAGRFFCAGADLKGFYTPNDGLKSRVSVFHAVLSRLARAEFPVIAAVNGAAAGAGMGLACACDIVIAGESAKFVMAYSKIGLSPDGGTTYFLPRRIGIGRAMELVFTNRSLSSREALEWGIANRVVADADLQNEAHTFAATLAQGPTRAYGAAKELLHSGWTESLESQVDKELRSIGAMARTRDAREAIAAFGEKRAPVFTGE
ncbi:MAG TPA: enoyl-CoA hydratase-related protein [Candidatus Binataceae bacterium]|nr:enoyl-CoA hydratase-related protein [Candidatus Binataceae bacterium]